MEVLLPIMLVDRSASFDTTSPFRFHDMDNGSSPDTTEHMSWANCPWLTMEEEKAKGAMTGGSEMLKMLKVFHV